MAEDESSIFTAQGGMHPDHPLLQRAQAALKQQLLTSKQRVEEDLREKQNALRVSKSFASCGGDGGWPPSLA